MVMEIRLYNEKGVKTMVDKAVLERLENDNFTEKEKAVIYELTKNVNLYTGALKELQAWIEILRTDFKRNKAYNPIEHIKTRVKLPKSILRKVYLKGLPLDAEVIKEELNDLAGLRIICTFKSDIYRLVEILKKYENIKVLEIKDYVSNPKPSGYQSYHMIVEIPVYMIDGKHTCKVEIQIRTMAMDFWACLEHKIKYKYNADIPNHIKDDLLNCSQVVSTLDDTMYGLHSLVQENNE